MLPIVQGGDTTNILIALEWFEPDNGGTAILGYIIYYKRVEDNEYVELLGETSSYDELSYKITFGVVEGANYAFIAKAVNRWG